MTVALILGVYSVGMVAACVAMVVGHRRGQRAL